MGLLFGSRTRAATLPSLLQAAGIDPRSAGAGGTPATPEESLRFSALWAALRLRSDLISTLPVDGFRYAPDGAQVPAPLSSLFRRPADGILWHEWLYSSQMDLDRYGNFFGQIVARDQAGYPLQIEPWPASEVRVLFNGRLIRAYRYGNTEFAPLDVWHERQYTVAGYRVGLSPLAYGAWAIGGGVAAQKFGLDFYATGAHPTGVLRNTEEAMLDPRVLDTAKSRFKAAVANRDIFATGKEWEFSPLSVDANSAQFLAQQDHSALDVARFIGVPANAIDAATSGSSLTYANLTQKQLDLLVNYLSPAIIRRERALTADALPAPRFVKFNTDALLRLDPTGRTDLMAKQIEAWTLTPDEGRALENRPPLTEEQIELLKSRKTAAKPVTADDEAESEDVPDDDGEDTAA